MCLYESATAAFNKDTRKVKETQEAIANLKSGLRVTEFLLSIKDLTPYMPPHPSKDTVLLMQEMLGFIRKFCDDQMPILLIMIENSKKYLAWDQENEDKHMQAEDEKRRTL